MFISDLEFLELICDLVLGNERRLSDSFSEGLHVFLSEWFGAIGNIRLLRPFPETSPVVYKEMSNIERSARGFSTKIILSEIFENVVVRVKEVAQSLEFFWRSQTFP